MQRFYKNMIRTLLLLLVLGAVFPFVYPWSDGKPLLSLNDLTFPAAPDLSLPDIALSQNDKPASQPVVVYKWQDAEGGWQFGSKPPQGVNYEVVELDPNTNLLPGVKPLPANPPTTTSEMEKQDSAGPDNGEPVIGYTPDKIEAMMEKTRQARDSLNEHYRTLEGIDK